MTNKNVTLSRELVDLLYRALNGGENRLTGMEHGRAFSELSAALANPVPPAGGEPEDPNSEWEDTFGPHYEDDSEPVEVVAVISTNPKERGHYFTPDQLRRHNQIYKTTPANGYTVELVDRAHVTRLQAEVAHQEAQHEAATRYAQTCLTAEANALAEVQRLQSELTKARELLLKSKTELEETWAIEWSSIPGDSVIHDIDAYLSNQSAPAAKDGE